MKKAILMALLALALATPALAASRRPCNDCKEANPDGRPSVTFLAGLGEADERDGTTTDLTSLSGRLVYPASEYLSLIFDVNHLHGDASPAGFGYAAGCRTFPAQDASSTLYSVGLRLFF